MSQECLETCPHIIKIRALNNKTIISAALGNENPDFVRDLCDRRLSDALEQALDCIGPELKTFIVKKGLFRKRQVIETKPVCRLDLQKNSI